MMMMTTGVPPDGALNMEDVVFDADFYHNTYPDLQNAFHHDNARLKRHWHEYGISEGRTCSVVLDLTFYLQKHPDLQRAFGTDYKRVYKHFFEYGIQEMRRSSPYYDPDAYKANNPWLASLTPKQMLWHFKNQGFAQGLSAAKTFAAVSAAPFARSPEELVFDADYYHNRYPDLQNAFHHDNAKLHHHWHEYGIGEGRACSEALDLTFYLAKYPDLQQAFGRDYRRAYKHFFEYGIKEMRQSSPSYDPRAYQARFGLIGFDGHQLLHHFMNYGRKNV
jgi:hypothetical protein